MRICGAAPERELRHPAGDVVPIAKGFIPLRRKGTGLAGVLSGFLQRGVETVAPDADSPLGVDELNGVQAEVAAPHHRLPDPDAGFHEIDPLAYGYSAGCRRSLHAFSVSGAAG